MSSSYYILCNSDQDVPNALRIICQGMDLETVLTSREIMGIAHFYVQSGPEYRPDGYIASAGIRQGALSTIGIDIDTIIYFPLGKQCELQNQQRHILRGAMSLLSEDDRDMSFEFNDILLMYRKEGHLFVNSNSTLWTFDQLSLLPHPYSAVQ